MSKDGRLRTAVAAGGTMLAPSWVWAQQSPERYRYGYGPHMMDWAGGWYGMILVASRTTSPIARWIVRSDR